MVAILTSSLGGSHKVNGKRIPTCLQIFCSVNGKLS